MTKDIIIRGKTITFTSNGATPIFFKQFFHKDLLKSISMSGQEIEIASEDIPALAFIMAKQGDKADMMHLKEEHYIEWLSLFDPLDIPMKGGEIFAVYLSDSIPTEEPKKKMDENLSE